MTELRRRYSARIKIDADTWEDFCSALREIYLELDRADRGEMEAIDMVSGGVSSSFAVFGNRKDEITPEVYRERLQRYIESRKQGI